MPYRTIRGGITRKHRENNQIALNAFFAQLNKDGHRRTFGRNRKVEKMPGAPGYDFKSKYLGI